MLSLRLLPTPTCQQQYPVFLTLQLPTYLDQSPYYLRYSRCPVCMPFHRHSTFRSQVPQTEAVLFSKGENDCSTLNMACSLPSWFLMRVFHLSLTYLIISRRYTVPIYFFTVLLRKYKTIPITLLTILLHSSSVLFIPLNFMRNYVKSYNCLTCLLRSVN